MTRLETHFFAAVCALAAQWVGSQAMAQSSELLRIDHYVPHRSTVPAIAGDLVQLYVRERVDAGMLARTSNFGNRVVLFVHGAGTPAEVAFDVPYGDYSWMAHLASAGFDVFSVDMTGYGRSTRPHVMNDACNLNDQQRQQVLGRDCRPSYAFQITNIESDWADIDAVVDFLRELRNVDRVSLVAWSLGGPRAGGYAARNPSKVDRVVLLAPAYGRDRASEGPETLPVAGSAMSKQSRSDFVGNWNRQVGCDGQYEPAVAEAVFDEMLASDPVGATWGTGVRRAPSVTVWGWNQAAVSRSRTPMLIVQGIHDGQVPPERAQALYQDLGASEKVYLDLGCASHNAMWERVHGLLFDASLEWLQSGTVNGQSQGVVKMGY